MREKQTLTSGNWRQKLGEGAEWDSGKVALLESVSENLGDRWTDHFGKNDASDTEKPIQEMRKEEYQRYTENLKDCLETGEELQEFSILQLT